MATMMATASAISEAQCAFIFTTPRSTKIVSSGSTAKIVDKRYEWPMGLKIWVYIVGFSLSGCGRQSSELVGSPRMEASSTCTV